MSALIGSPEHPINVLHGHGKRTPFGRNKWDHIHTTHGKMAHHFRVAATYRAKEEELKLFQLLEKEYQPLEKTGGDEKIQSSSSRLIETLFVKFIYPWSVIFADEDEAIDTATGTFHLTESGAKALERMSDSLILLRAFASTIQLYFDAKAAVKSCTYSSFTKALMTGFIAAGSGLIAVGMIVGAEILLKPLFLIQIVVAVAVLCRGIVDFFHLRREKIKNKEALAKNTKELAEYAKTINKSRELQLGIERLEREEHLPREERTQAFSAIKTQLGQLRQQREELLKSREYTEATIQFDHAMEHRLKLELERKKIKREYSEAWTDVGLGLNNILASGVGLFVSSYAGLIIATVNVMIAFITFGFSSMKHYVDDNYLKGQNEQETKERHELHYTQVLEESLEPERKIGWWSRLLSFGTRREAIKEQEHRAIQEAIALRSQSDPSSSTSATPFLASLRPEEKTRHGLKDSVIQHEEGVDYGLGQYRQKYDKATNTRFVKRDGSGPDHQLQMPERWDKDLQGDADEGSGSYRR